VVEPGRRARLVAGSAVVVTMVLALWAVAYDYRGGFDHHVEVTAEVSTVGDSLQVGDIVTYRDVIVGQVGGFAPAAGGSARLTLRLGADQADSIPANVTALAVPVDLFGATEVVLVAPRQVAGTLRAGQLVLPETGAGATGLQTALADAYDLLTSVRPAELSAALTALGNAVDGRGDELHELVREANATLRTIAPTLPHLSSTIENLATVTDQLAARAPDLLATVGNLLVPAREALRLQASITTLLGVATTTVRSGTRLLRANSDQVITVITTQQPFLRALAVDPDLAGRIATGLGEVATAVNSIAPHGRVRADAYIRGLNLSGIVQTFAGEPSVVVQGDPPLYGPGDCPRFAGASSSCRSARIGSISTPGTSSAPGSAVGGAEENAVAEALATQLTGLRSDELAPGLGALLAPVLRGQLVVLR
jgi:phospholipid/cholesterol/gamma-HCH transport system substrate-binding protein